MIGPFVTSTSDALYKVKLTFFDRDRVRAALDKRTWKFLSRFGAYTRSDAKQSMRRSTHAAPPYHPPAVHEGSLKKFLYFGFDKTNRSVVIGPVKLSRRGSNGERRILEGPSYDALGGEVPNVLEYGGNRQVIPNPRRKKRKIGDYGAIAIGRAGGRSTRLIRNYQGREVMVTFAMITSPAMLDKVNATEAIVFGPEYQSFDLKPRPYMGPAFRKNLAPAKLEQIWAGI
ncbi:MAG: hypothetical protein IJG83_05550 [Thermoguttaceae bacterium]|nr:hypothetical protein [Thermoguttaceae bacterium]